MQPTLLSSPLNLVCYAILLTTAALHIAFGASYLALGRFTHQYSDSLPLAAFTITIGVYLVLAVAAGLYCFFRPPSSSRLVFLLWSSGLINVTFTFAVAMLEVRDYVRTTQLFIQFGMPLPEASQFQTSLKLALADGIISFVLGLPASVLLMHVSNLRLGLFDAQPKIKVLLEGEGESWSEPGEPALGGPGSKQLTREMGFEASREVEKAVQL